MRFVDGPREPELPPECYHDGRQIRIVRIESAPIEAVILTPLAWIEYHWLLKGSLLCLGPGRCQFHDLESKFRAYVGAESRIKTGRVIQREIAYKKTRTIQNVPEVLIVPIVLEVTRQAADQLKAFGSYAGHWFRFERSSKGCKATPLGPFEGTPPQPFPIEPIIDAAWGRFQATGHSLPTDVPPSIPIDRKRRKAQ